MCGYAAGSRVWASPCTFAMNLLTVTTCCRRQSHEENGEKLVDNLCVCVRVIRISANPSITRTREASAINCAEATQELSDGLH